MNKKKIEDYIVNKQLDLDKIVDDYTPYIKKIINNTIGGNLNSEDKEEILLDTFFILWKKFNDKNNIYSLDSYIAGITKNLVKEKFKKLHYTLDISNFENVIEIASYEMYQEEREEVLKLKSCFKNLKSIDIKIINLFYYSSKSIKDIAEELDISPINVKTRLHRIRKNLQKQLSKGDNF